MTTVTHPLEVGTQVRILVPNFDDNEGMERHAPAGELGKVINRDYHDNGDGWAYTVVQEPSGVTGIWFSFDFQAGEIVLAQ